MNREEIMDLSLSDQMIEVVFFFFFEMNILAYAGPEVLLIALSFIFL